METIDPRIEEIYEADPQLRFVGAGTIADVLKAAATAGIIPTATVTTEYAADIHQPGLRVQEVGSGTLREVEAFVKVLSPVHNPTLLARTKTSYPAHTTEWQPVPEGAPEDSND
ncbi:hypothetical protein [Arthrobacter sp. UYCo732]|uniref:hypothetical protein n=1 Tax=Arthrobacter sp. UYCo732 TaxID=3156336 RepID=UPI0033976A42